MTSVAMLGTGIMGAGMARNMIRSGLEVTVWNRSPEKAQALADDGATVSSDPADAVAGADIVVTMLYDLPAVQDVMGPLLADLGDDCLWIQSSTVGLAGAQQLGEWAAQHGVDHLDAPVLGTRKPAEDGALTVLVGGPRTLEGRAAQVFDAVGSTTVWVGENPGDGHRMKLVANSWVLSLVAGTGQAVAAAQGLGVDPRQFLSLIESGPLAAGYAQIKGDTMLTDSSQVSFPVDGASKDAGLIATALEEAGVAADVVRAIDGRLTAASEAGYGAHDMAAILHGFVADDTRGR